MLACSQDRDYPQVKCSMRCLLLKEKRTRCKPGFLDRLNTVFVFLTVLLAISTVAMAIASPGWGEEVDVLSLGRADSASDNPLFMVEGSSDARYLRGAVGIEYDGKEWSLEKVEGEGLNISADRDELPLYPTELALSPSFHGRESLNAASLMDDRRYLELPDEIAPRIEDLSLEITERFDTPFEKARAIEVFLKINYTYDMDFAPAPSGWEPNDWFLFESEEGICANFASAFVVLARASDIPARMAAGYYVRAGSGEQFVYGDQAHAWAEVGFEGLGWVVFDAT